MNTTTLEPTKRILRTVIAIVIAIASVLPYFIGQAHFGSDKITAALTQIGLVATLVTAFASSPAGNYLFGLIGLDATSVTKLTGDLTTTGTDATSTVTAAVAGGTTVVADAKTVAADVAATSTPPAL